MPLSERPLESALFGCGVYAVTADSLPALRCALEAARSLSGALVIVRIPVDSVEAIHAVEAAGGRLCDILVTLGGPLASTLQTRVAEVTVRRAQAADADALSTMATRSFRAATTHWHSDPRLPTARADELYGRWAAALAQGATNEAPLFIAETREHSIAGFLSLALEADDTWHVPLTGVAPECRGRGVLSAMLDAAAITCGRPAVPQTLHYETQLTNIAALRAVSRRGLVVRSSRLTFHLWVPEA